MGWVGSEGWALEARGCTVANVLVFRVRVIVSVMDRENKVRGGE